jgi:hypothetical protein
MKVVDVVLPLAVALVCCGGEIIVEQSGDIGMPPGGYTLPITQTMSVFDPTKIEAIQLDIVSSTQIDGQAPTPPGGVCISNLTLLVPN